MAVKATLIDIKGKPAGDMNLPEGIFGVRPKEQLLFDAVIMLLASRRQGTAKTKTRSEVRGGGRKPYKQKGTGNARQGTTRSPLLPGGGRVFGPQPRSYEYRLPRKVRNQALAGALSQKMQEGKLFVMDAVSLKKPATKTVSGMIEGLKANKTLVVDSENKILEKSVRNVSNAKYLDVKGLNVYDILKYDHLLLSSDSIKKIEERLAS